MTRQLLRLPLLAYAMAPVPVRHGAPRAWRLSSRRWSSILSRSGIGRAWYLKFVYDLGKLNLVNMLCSLFAVRNSLDLNLNWPLRRWVVDGWDVLSVERVGKRNIYNSYALTISISSI